MNRLTAWIRKLATPRRPGESLRIESSIRLGPHHTMHCVSLGGNQWVLLCHPQGAIELSRETGVEARAESAAGGAR